MKFCLICGVEFSPTRKNQKFCRAECREVFYRNQYGKTFTGIRQCRFCKKTFSTTDKRKLDCSRECHTGYQNSVRPTSQEVDRECPVCKNLFKPLQKRGVGRTCCSTACNEIRRFGEAFAARKAERLSRPAKVPRLGLPQEYNEKKRDRHLKKTYGISLQDYDRMWEEQNGVCAICKNPETAVDGVSGRTKRLAVDHCHTKGHVRKLLCADCNHTLGCLNEDISLFEAAIKYLQEHKK